jgi:fructose-bisphosphate aldolase, class I
VLRFSDVLGASYNLRVHIVRAAINDSLVSLSAALLRVSPTCCSFPHLGCRRARVQSTVARAKFEMLCDLLVASFFGFNVFRRILLAHKSLYLTCFALQSYVAGEESMYDQVHAMRSRIITSPSFTGDKVLGAILFENTMDRSIDGIPTGQYLWERKNVIPFLKVDKGLEDEKDGVQLMKPIPGLDALLARGKSLGMFGTKMRSVINSANPDGIKAIVQQQFEIGKQIIRAGLVPIIEPEVNIKSPDKAECETLLKACLLDELNRLGDDENVMLKLSLPSVDNFYAECISHPRCVRVVALSGGYSRADANAILARQKGMIASFSRALSEGLNHNQSDDDFNKALQEAVDSIYEASRSG